MNIKLHFLFILLFITCFIPKLILSLNTNIITITDTINERVIQSKIYSDNTILLRLINVTTSGCSDNQVYLRIINPDGTFNNDVVIRDDRILNENFCIPSTNQLVEGGITLDGIRIYSLQPKLILLTYFCKLEQGTNVAGICGMLINWNNTIQSQIDFGQTCTDSSIVINNDGGEFLLACYLNDFNQGLLINWSRYNVDSKNGTINIKDRGTINNINTSSQNFRDLFPTEDGGYGILTYRTDKLAIFLYLIPPLPSSSSSSSSSSSTSKVRGPFQLYKPTQTIITLNILKCGISFVEFGYNCLIYLNNEFNILVNIDFLDSGSIISTNEFIISNPIDIAAPINIINAESLYYGGYIILIQNLNNVVGLIYSNNGILFSDAGGNNWQMPGLTIDGIGLIYTGNLGVFTNNTIWSIANSIQGIKLITNDLLSNYSSNINDESKNNLLAFGNSFVSSVNPTIGSVINTNPNLNIISITFVNLIELSNGNISIWQSSNSGDVSQDILRQSFSGNNLQYVSIGNDNKTVTISVFESTFNMPGQQYYVKVDNGFVRDLRTGQDLLGIRENRWNFNTSKFLLNPAVIVSLSSSSSSSSS
jgi:hypothetical protein